MKQKEKITEWLFSEYKKFFQTHGCFPDQKDGDGLSLICDAVYTKIEKAEIRIPYDEVYIFLQSRTKRFQDRVKKEIYRKEPEELEIELLPYTFSVCKVSDYSGVDLTQPFVFIAVTDNERSLICPADRLPANVTEKEDSFRGFRLKGSLGFNLIGILAEITVLLARNTISILAVSTFDTDYIFVKEQRFEEAVEVLKKNKYAVLQ